LGQFFKLGQVLPKLYRLKRTDAPFRVVFTDPQGKQVRRHFVDEGKAKAYHRELLAKARVGGTAGLVMDAEMRADYFGARQLLDGVPLMTAVRYYLSHRPSAVTSTPLADVLKIFLQDKRRIGRADRTVKSLDSTLSAFLAVSPSRLVADFTRDAVTRYLDALDLPPATIRNHRARLATFGNWLARRQYLPENPVQHIDVASHDIRSPRVLTPFEAERVMQAAVDYRGGIFAAMYAIALFAGLRHGEIVRLTWDDVFLDGPEPLIRVGRGKIRGRRSIRVVPIQPALLSWLKWARVQNLPLVDLRESRKIREVVEWQEDIGRHSFISYRLAMIGDEVRVAREAGNSPDVIYRHYFQLVTRRDALRYFSNWSIPYDPDWRSAKALREFEPVSYGVRPLTVAEVKALKARETNIEFITGKPGGGKSMTAVKVIVDELLHGDRPIVTNLALDLGRLQEYIHELGGKTVVAERVRFLTHEETFKFYTIRGHHVTVTEPARPEDLFDYSKSQEHPESAGGVFYVIDECHNYFSTKAKIDEDSPMFKWASQHRKLKDFCYFVTQSIENVHAKIRRLGQQFNYIRNLRKETFRGFRRGDGFERTVYLHIPTGEGSIPIHVEKFKLDCSGLASCYFTAGGVGVKAMGNADGGFQKKGLHMRWIWVAFFVAVLGLSSAIFLVPWLLGRVGKRIIEKDPEPSAHVVDSTPVAKAKEQPPAPLPAPASKPPPSAPQSGSSDAVVYATGYVLGRGMITVSMSDGTTRTERDTELQHVERNSITLSGVKLFFRGAQRTAIDRPQPDALVATGPDNQQPVALPAPPPEPSTSWQQHSDGVSRIIKPSSGPGR